MPSMTLGSSVNELPKRETTMIKIVRNKDDHEAALEAIDRLVTLDPRVGSAEADELEVLALLVEEYESQTWTETLPTPVEALQFRMEQQSLSQRDLIPYVGSRSRVSEVLSGKRTLTLGMIRALHEGLGIPAHVLIQEEASATEEQPIEWAKFPVKEMALRRWLPAEAVKSTEAGIQAVRSFFAALGEPAVAGTLYRKTRHIRAGRTTDPYSLDAWTARVILLARQRELPGEYEAGCVSADLMRELARLSWSENGPTLAQEFLGRYGIALIIEPHLPRTHLDGAAILVDPKRPIVGMTLRYDRIDNFWFVLMHELAHISLHSSSDVDEFFDDLEVKDVDELEQEADALTGEVLVPNDSWQASPASRLRTPEAAEHLAKQLGVHPAIVAGRMRHSFGSYRILNQLVGHGDVRKCFPDVVWPS